MFYKIHKSYRDIVAVCDSDLIDKVFEEEEFQLYVKESFYKDKEASKEELIQVIEDMSREDAIFNFVGNESVQIALELGMIDEEGIKKIQGVPFAMVLM